ncbi:zinc finger, CCHC-type containing protein, partial [Tanacetum coccineum]
FVGYTEHSKAFRFFAIEPNDLVSINSIIESRDAIFDENRFSSVLRPSQRSLKDGTEDIGGSVVPKEVVQQPELKLRKNKRNRTPMNFGPEFQLYLTEGTKDEVSNQLSYCFIVEDDPKTFDEAMKSHDVAFYKEVINDEMDSIMGNNTWVLADLPPGCKPIGCKWIFKRKLKVDGTIENTIRLLISMASIHNLIIHHIDVKAAFLNGKLEEEVYMNQPQGFIMPGNENKVCKLIKSPYGLKQAPEQWHQKFDEVVLSNGYLLNQTDKCVYSKFDESSKGVIVCLYVDDMLIFGTDQVHVYLTKEFLSSRFSIKDMGEADVILVSTPMDTSEKLMPNNGQVVSQLEYSRVIGCLMYVMNYQGRSREVPKLRTEAKKQEKQSLEVVTRRTNPKTPFRPIFSSIMSSSPHSTIVPSDSNIKDAFSSTNILNYFSASPGNIFPNPFEKISSPKDSETSVESPILISPSLSVGFSSPIRSTTPPPSYSFNELSNSMKISLWIIPRPIGSEPVPEEPNESNAC